MKRNIQMSIIYASAFIISCVIAFLSFIFEWHTISTFMLLLSFLAVATALFLMYNFILAIIETPLNYIRFKRIEEYLENGEVEKIAEIIKNKGPKPDKKMVEEIHESGESKEKQEGQDPNFEEKKIAEMIASSSPRSEALTYQPQRKFSYWYCALSALSEMQDEKAKTYIYYYASCMENPIIQLYAKRALRYQAKQSGFEDISIYIIQMNFRENVDNLEHTYD
ncbi:MAG: hypothetical protein GF308_10775 [Candidatus Heimdallarchaeota archaeon]|nr:hypothetical protein [Candidatus Heimdallarchaeota archaeon]